MCSRTQTKWPFLNKANCSPNSLLSLTLVTECKQETAVFSALYTRGTTFVTSNLLPGRGSRFKEGSTLKGKNLLV